MVGIWRDVQDKPNQMSDSLWCSVSSRFKDSVNNGVVLSGEVVMELLGVLIVGHLNTCESENMVRANGPWEPYTTH